MDGEGLRRRRRLLRLTQEQLARELNVTRQTVYAWETGKAQAHWRVLELAMDALVYEYGWEWHEWMQALRQEREDERGHGKDHADGG
ncbi:MAG TPA: helix-turn-helix domain-containing protein [Polyangiaceae bacterium]|jgi:transcriptional regulator with XRE-family HTH domain|nr:helix-turn-helix domain-containing protein [Polyangiaceae bacterium]